MVPSLSNWASSAASSSRRCPHPFDGSQASLVPSPTAQQRPLLSLGHPYRPKPDQDLARGVPAFPQGLLQSKGWDMQGLGPYRALWRGLQQPLWSQVTHPGSLERSTAQWSPQAVPANCISPGRQAGLAQLAASALALPGT